MNDSNAIVALFQRYLDNQCTPAEIAQLLEYFDAGDNEALLSELVLKRLEEENSGGNSREALINQIFSNIRAEIAGSEKPAVVVVPWHRRTWVRVAAAACIIVLAGLGYLMMPVNKGDDSFSAALPAPRQHPIVPGKAAAQLTLNDGSTIMLDSAANGELAIQGAVKVTKAGGEISYAGKEEAPVATYNKLSTARGNQYQVTLADGTKAWLNAASSIRFPTAFTAHERKVEVTGEVYFEVAHNAAKPFIVKISSPSGADGGEIKVLGTHFNVNAYADEASVKTTLLEGSVQLTKDQRSRLLKPGQQAITQYQQAGINVTAADVDKVVAWKNGFFLFEGDNITTIMRQVSRWYDIDVTYEGTANQETFSGMLSRSSNINQVLKILSEGGLKFTIDGKKINIVK